MARPKLSPVMVTVEAEVDLADIAGQLEEAGWHYQDNCTQAGVADGWHHEDDCPTFLGFPDVLEVIASLHRQAHPSQHPEPALCREEPCRSVPLTAWKRPR